MKRFDDRGMMIIPSPIHEEITKRRTLLAVRQCYCHNGHDLMYSRAKFNNLPGIALKVVQNERTGLVVLSPIYGDKTKISLDIDLIEGQVVDICCPVCGGGLPVFDSCSCGANLVSIFLVPAHDFGECIGICNRVGCFNSVIKSAGELMTYSMIDIG